MSEAHINPYHSSLPAGKTKSVATSLRGLTKLEVLVVLSILVTLGALLLPSPHMGCCGGPGTACRNNLKQIGLALHNYQDVYGSLPPAYVCDNQGVPAHSWRVLILPFVDKQDVYERYRFDEPWNGPHNIQLQDEMPYCYRCPAYHHQVAYDSREGQHLRRLTNYAVVVSSGSLFDDRDNPSRARAEDDDTLLAVEVRQHAVHWMSPIDVTPEQLLTDLRRSVSEENANHQGTLTAMLESGYAERIPHDMPEVELRALIVDADDRPEEPANAAGARYGPLCGPVILGHCCR